MLTWTISYTGTPEERDIAGAMHLINKENARRVNRVDEAGELIVPLLPHSTNEEIKSSYLAILEIKAAKSHKTAIESAAAALGQAENMKKLWKDATPTQQQAALSALKSE